MKSRTIEGALWVGVLVVVLGTLGWAARRLASDETTTLWLETTPERASAWLDGNFLGTTPIEAVRVSAGEHVLLLTKSGRLHLTERVTFEAGENRLRFDLAKRADGTLRIGSNPAGADVFVDGEPRGQTPLVLEGVTPGAHAVRLSLVNYVDWTANVEVEPDSVRPIDVTLRTRTEAHYLAMLRANPNDATTRCDLAHYYVLGGRWEDVERELAGALVASRQPGGAGYESRIHQEITKIWGRMFNYDDHERGRKAVVGLFARAAEACPDAPEYYSAAVLYADECEMDVEARRIVELAIRRFDESDTWLGKLPYNMAQTWTTERIEARLNASLRKNPKDFVALYRRMDLNRQRGKLDEAVTDGTAAAALAKDTNVQARIMAVVAGLHERRKKYAEAVAAWEQAVALETDDVEVACRWRLKLAADALKVDDKQKARTAFEEVLNRTKNAAVRQQAENGIKGL